MLPHSIQQQAGTVIINSDPHTKDGSHWLAFHFEPKSSKAFYFDSYGHPPYNPHTQAFIRRNCTVWDYNTIQLQGPTILVYGKYFCLFALFMDRRFAQNNTWTCLLLTLLTAKSQLFTQKFGTLCGTPVVASAVPRHITSEYFIHILQFYFRLRQRCL